jgi:hypothetical protein
LPSAAVIVSAPSRRRGCCCRVAGDDVGERVAGAVDVGAAGQGQVLDIGAERVADRRLHRVGAAAHGGGFRHHVAGVVDHVGVVAVAADQRVGADAAVEGVVAAVAGDDVGVAVAGAVDVAAAGQGQVVDVGAEREAHRRLHQVGASLAFSVTTSPALSTR